MWSATEEPSGATESSPPETMIHTKETCEQNKNQLESLKEIMMKSQQSLKKKEEEVQEYARRLSKIKSRAKLSRRSKEGASSSKEAQLHKTESIAKDTTDDVIDDISQAKTPKAKSSLLQRKLAENRKVFEQRSKELTETKRAVEEKVEAIRQQLEETDLVTAEMHKEQLAVTPIRSLMITSDVMAPIHIQDIQEKENKIMELNKKILELEATVLDLQENLKEKDSVIDSKTKAITLMSADLSKKGKTTLDTLEDTKDEMRTMQENFILIEISLKNKNASLLQQLEQRDNRIEELEHTVNRFEEQLKEQKIAESASADFSHSTMDTLVETKDAMKSMQENFILIESSLKLKNDNLLQQLEEYEIKLAEAKERIFQLESGIGIVTTPTVEDLQFRIDKLEHSYRQLLDEKYQLQKNITEMQAQIISRSVYDNGAVIEKDNRIAELENLIEELKQSNELLKEESKAELQKQIIELSTKNEEYSNKIVDLETQVHDLEMKKDEIAAKLSDERAVPKENDKVKQLTKELEELNKSMIKLKAQHRSKVKNLQKQLESFKMVSDTNAELVRLGNQVALLEEEKGNLQLSLVDFDELKASAGDWQERVADLESKVSSQTKEIQMHIDTIATLENQKLDLMQELHVAKQEVSGLEAKNAESENLRVTAEMKVVELEEQLEVAHREPREKLESPSESEYNELLKKIDALTQENSELYGKLSKLEEKGTSDTGSTESFEAIQVNGRNDLLKKIEDLEQKNNELTLKLAKLEEKDSSHAGSTESFETINDTDRSELLKKIDQLTQENSDLTMKLSRIEEKGSSDTGSTESFERIPEHNESMTKIELLTQENSELVIKLTKLEERLSQIESGQLDDSKIDSALETLGDARDSQLQIETLRRENDNLMVELAQLQAASAMVQSVNVTSCVTDDDARSKIATLEEENARMTKALAQLEEYINDQKEELSKMAREKEDLNLKLERMACDDIARERFELIDKLEKLSQEKQGIAQERQELHEQISTLLQKSSDEVSEMRKAEEAACQQSQAVTIASLEKEVESSKVLIAEYKNQVEEMNMKLQSMETRLQEKARQLVEYEGSREKLEGLERELIDMHSTAEEWKFKYDDMQVKMQTLEEGKASIEEALGTLESNNKELLEVIKEKDAATSSLRGQFQDTVGLLETRLQDEMANMTAKEREIADLRAIIESKDQELHAKYAQLQNEMITIDSLQDELSNCQIKLKENETTLSSSMEEVARLSDIMREKEEQIQVLKNNISKINELLWLSKAEFHEILENSRDKEISYIELYNKHEDILKENNDLSRKVEDMSKRDEDVKNELIEKEQEIASLLVVKEELDVQIEEIKSDKVEAEKRIWELQTILDNQAAYVEKVQSDLTAEYKQMEQLKIKHTEDIAMLNQRLEDLVEELIAKVKENEDMTAELEQKEELLDKNVTKELKISLEEKVADLEQKLSESENKLQAQSEKMKKIVATFNKKKAACQELEARVAELEEKWTTEKDEKEVKNKKIQEVENSIREKDNKIADLEEKLSQSRNDSAESHASFERVTKESVSLKEKMTVLMEQIAEMGEEIERQRTELECVSLQVITETTAKEDVATKYELYKENVSKEEEQKQAVLDDVKEQARELSVRMQVMETEYVEQLALIKNLQAENGLLLSKQAQINEKLENVEKESEERHLLIKQLQEKITTMTVAVQVPDEDTREDDTRVAQHCDHSDQCQNLMQALEARLQERQAEIENLNNELANSYGNIMLFHDESLRYNDMMMQTAQERFNQSLMDQTNILQQQIDSLKVEKTTNEQRISELEAELEEYKRKSAEKTLCEQRISELEAELEEYKRKIAERRSEDSNTVQISATDGQQQQEQDDTPQVFDASKIFGTIVTSDADAPDKKETMRLQSLLNEKASQCSERAKEVDHLLENIEEEKLYMQQLRAQCDDQVEHWKNQYEDVQNKLKQMQSLLSEKSTQVDSLNEELNKMMCYASELRSLQEQHSAIQAKSVRLEQLVTERDAQIDSLVMELNTVQQWMNGQLQQHADVKHGLQTEISIKNAEIAALRTELISARETVETLTTEQDQQNWEQRILTTVTERDLLQLQVNDLTRSLEELRESLTTQRDLQIELENALREKDQAQAIIANLTQTLKDLQQSSSESKTREDSLKELTFIERSATEQEGQMSVSAEEPISRQDHTESAESSVKKETQRETQLDIGSNWDNDSSEKINIDEEFWGWNPEDAQLADNQHFSGPMTLIPDAEVQLRAQVGDLQDRIKDLEAQNAKIAEESKAMQIKSGKLIKKLKEYKVQVESLQQQLKTQKQTGSFFDLDTAIEEELKIQIANLEKDLSKIKEEKKNLIFEKEALLKRLDVLVSASERYLEMKERQDMEVKVLHIQNKELNNKVQSLEWRLQENETDTQDTSSSQCEDQIDSSHYKSDAPLSAPVSNKCKEEIDDLKDELEALAAENEQLQHYLEEQKATIANLELKESNNIGELMEKLDVLNNQNSQLQSALNKGKEEYDVLRKQYEQSLIDANDHVTAMRQNNDLLKIEFSEKIDKLEVEVNNLQKALKEKEDLESRIDILMNSEEKLATVNASLMEVTELLNARVQEVADLKQELQNQYMGRQQTEAALQSEIQNLSKKLDERKQELDILRQAFDYKEHELVQQNSMETVSNIVSEATQELVQRHAIEIEERDKKLHDLTEKLTALQSLVDEHISKSRDSATQLETQQQQITYLKEDLIERNSIIEAIKADTNSMNEKLQEKQQELIRHEEEKSRLTVEFDKCLANIEHLQSQLNAMKSTAINLQECNSRIHDLEQEAQVLKTEKESFLLQYDQIMKTYQAHLENDKQEIDTLKHDLREKIEQLHYVNTQLCAKENDLEEIRATMTDKDSLLETTRQELNEKRAELEKLRSEQPSSKTIESPPVFGTGNDGDAELQSTIDELRTQMEAKQQELEHLKYILSENTYPTIIQQMQDRINCLYNEKATLEATLRITMENLTDKQEQVNILTQCISGQGQEHIFKEEVSSLSRDRRSVHQEEIVHLQNELHAKEQEMNELKYVIAEKDSQLCLQASMEPQSDDFELRETVQRLTGELYGKEQEVQTLKSTIAELQEEILHLKDLERLLSEESRSAIERLTSEKEQIRVEAEEFLRKELRIKEMEIGEIKQKLSEENQKLLTEFHLKNNDIENLKTQMVQLRDEWSSKLQQKQNELIHTTDDLAEKERRLAELSITKDAELHNLKMQIREKEARIEELLALSAEEEKQLNELRQTVATKETEVITLKNLLEQKVSEYELIQHALKKDVSVIEAVVPKSSKIAETSDDKETASNELDIALYMLHQRDVRCEELTHELMQLLEERDTLQLRLSNAIRVNEELRKASSVEASPMKDSLSVSQEIAEPIVEQPSPSKSEGPIEIAKEAIDVPLEDKQTLALKLSQLHSVSHTKDVRLKDERELRHTQQMSLLAHRDVLNTLPPEAAARLVNANYTLSRDVQSQSSVLLNWLWGKSTPKVVHM